MPTETTYDATASETSSTLPDDKPKVPFVRRAFSWLRRPSRSKWILWWASVAVLTMGASLGVYLTRDVIDWPKTFASGRDLAQIVAVLVGGVWAYRRFIRQREHQPKANINHLLDWFFLDPDHRYVRVTAHVKNIGQIAIKPPNLTIELRQLAPLPPDVASRLHDLPLMDPEVVRSNFPDLGKREVDVAEESILLDPGEEHDFSADFVLKRDVEVIEVTSQLDCDPDSPDVAWFETSLHHLGPDVPRSDTPVKAAGNNEPSASSGGRPTPTGMDRL